MGVLVIIFFVTPIVCFISAIIMVLAAVNTAFRFKKMEAQLQQLVPGYASV